MSDTEDLVYEGQDSINTKKSKKSKNNSFTAMISDLIRSLPYKLFFFLFILLLIVNSDIFINMVLSKKHKEYSMAPNTMGTVILTLYTIGLLAIIVLLQKGGII